MLQNIRLLVEYDGTPYVGWQRQQGLPSIQGTLEEALASVVGPLEFPLSCAGRTDAGVHAYGQVVNFRTHHPKEPRRYAPALNFFLPDSIRIHLAEGAPLGFDARQSARSKRYRYRVYEGPHPLAIDMRRAWHVRRRLDLDAMRRAADMLLGERDFESFRSAHCDAAHAIRTMHAITITAEERLPMGKFVDIVFHANAFCRHMCRILAGTITEVGFGQRTLRDVQRALEVKERASAGITAPPWGLTMLQVLY